MSQSTADPASAGVDVAPGVRVTGPMLPGYEAVLTVDALAFVGLLERRFGAERRRLLAARADRQDRLDRGELPAFLPETERVRRGNWKVQPAPADLRDRRVEITGPVERKMIINALNSGANVFMADVEDSLSPTWSNVVEGQINLKDAVAGTISYWDPASGKEYRVGETPATLVVRPRGWHLEEAHVLVDGTPVSAGLFDFALYLFHNVGALRAKGGGPHFYLPKLENHREARLWAEVIGAGEEHLGLPRGTVRVTVLIETILAAFEMDEILYELRDFATGLNCGRWDYIFSYIKKFRNRPDFVLPERNAVTMSVPFLRAYSLLLIRTCHKRGAHAMGGMAAFIPIKGDAAANEAALANVRKDKEREASDGHDGTWVAHPGLIEIAKEVFDAHMPGPDQLGKMREDVHVTPRDLLAAPEGPITEEGVRNNIRVAVQYLEAWLGGNGCVPLYNLMEDAATAEICRSQIWQWLRHGAALADGRTLDEALVRSLLDEEMASLRRALGQERFARGHFDDATELFLDVATAPVFVDFLTEPAYRRLCAAEG
ncbi:MAG: malate synthase A [Rhodospirillales bacterium]|nr:malate synthase A [Rhodospirillales bacterium]